MLNINALLQRLCISRTAAASTRSRRQPGTTAAIAKICKLEPRLLLAGEDGQQAQGFQIEDGFADGSSKSYQIEAVDGGTLVVMTSEIDAGNGTDGEIFLESFIANGNVVSSGPGGVNDTSGVVSEINTVAGTYAVVAHDRDSNESLDLRISAEGSNSAPIVPPQTFSIDENAAGLTSVGFVQVEDFDTLQDHTLWIVGGTGENLFRLNGGTGEVIVRPGADLNFEAVSSYTLQIRATDNGDPALSGTGTITINLTDVNEAPVVQNDTFSVSSNAGVGTSVGTVAATDEDQTNPFGALRYSIQPGNVGGAFEIDAGTGEISVANTGALNSRSQHQLVVLVRDGGIPSLSDDAVITINVTAPPPVNDPNDQISEASPLTIGSSRSGFSISPSSDVDMFGFTVAAGQRIAFDIDANETGSNLNSAITLFDSAGNFLAIDIGNPAPGEPPSFDPYLEFTFTTAGTYYLGVSEISNIGYDPITGGDDRSGSTTGAFTLVTRAISPPIVTDQAFSLDENSPVATIVGTVSATDPDLGQPLEYDIVGGTGQGRFTIDNVTGQIVVANTTALDFEANPTFTLQVRVRDTGSPRLEDTATITINLNDLNEDPPVVADQTFFVDENRPVAHVVGTVVASDPDAGQTLDFAIVGGTGQAVFNIDSATGRIAVGDAAAMDFETNPSYTLLVRVRDDGNPRLAAVATITINLNDLNENAPVVANQTFFLDENSPLGQTVGTVAASDPDPGQSLEFAIIGGTGVVRFTIDSETGRIVVNDPAAMDFETNPGFTLLVRVRDDGNPQLATVATITIILRDLNEHAPVVEDQALAVSEAAGLGALVGRVAAQDADLRAPNNTLTFTLLSGNDGGAFAIDSATGDITVANPDAIDFESQQSFRLNVQVADGGAPNLTDAARITVNVLDVNDTVLIQDDSDARYGRSLSRWRRQFFLNNGELTRTWREGSAQSRPANWRFDDLPDGTYEVAVSWVPGTNRTANANYVVSDPTGTRLSANLNQQLAPSGSFGEQDKVWQTIGQITIVGGFANVSLTGSGPGVVVADGVRLTPVIAASAVAGGVGTDGSSDAAAASEPSFVAFSDASASSPIDEVFEALPSAAATDVAHASADRADSDTTVGDTPAAAVVAVDDRSDRRPNSFGFVAAHELDDFFEDYVDDALADALR